MSKQTRPALKTLPRYDPDNNIGAVDRVRFAMQNGRMDALTAPEIVQFERWKQIDDWIRSRRFGKDETEIISSHRQLRNLVISKYGVSYDTAERDIRNTKDLFKASQEDQEYARSVYIEQIEERAARCTKDSDYQKLMELASKLRGLFDEVKDVVPYDKLQAFQIIMEYNPEAIGLTRIENPDEVLERYRKKKITAQKMSDDAEDAQYVS